jgi:4-amino-4-deoxy-L-arabinose transferase-like glycosyltransferase
LTFLRTAYTVLLDNALTAALAWSLWLTWRALDSESDSRKRWFAAGALFAVGVSFLFKGFVGPAIYASGLLAWIAATRRWAEIRAFLHPLSLAAFLAPVLAWTIPFMLRASRPLQYEFFIANHFGRATSAYLSHPRPVWYYALHIWARFAPASLLLPFAVVAAWKGRRRPEGRGAHFLLCFSAGAAGLLSLSLAKDNVYLLPVYPALACLVGTWATRAVEEGRAGSGWMIALLSVVAALAIGAAITLSAKLEGPSISLGIWAAALAAGIGFLVLQLPRRDARRAGWAVAAMVAIAATMSVTPPLSTWYVAPRSIRSALQAITDGASGAELVLYRPDDQLRGGCSFYRNRTAEEIDDADALVDRLRRDPGTVAVVPVHLQVAELEPAATRAGVVLEESLRVSHAGMVPLALVRLHR